MPPKNSRSNEQDRSAISPSRTMTRPLNLLRISEAARELNISQRTVWRLIKTGELKIYRIGRSVRVPRDEIILYLERPRR